MEAHEYWYYFGKCNPKPVQIKSGRLPNPPYERFMTETECQNFIDSGGLVNPFKPPLSNPTK
jgi:hypothetical protein